MRAWPWRRRLGAELPPPQLRPERIRNEINQLVAIRDDALRVAPGSAFHSWLNGAIFALEWAASPYSAVPPSVPANRLRSGISTPVITSPP